MAVSRRWTPRIAWAAILALSCAGCPHTTTGGGDASTSDADCCDSASAPDDGGDAQCVGSIELSPVTFVNGYTGTRQTCSEAGVEPVTVWAFRDGVLARGGTYDCGQSVVLTDLAPGQYQVAMIGFVDGNPFGQDKPLPWYTVGATLLPGVYGGYVASCTEGLAACEPIVVDLPECQSTTAAADVFCWSGISQVADACGF
jgi:hypothetical protein